MLHSFLFFKIISEDQWLHTKIYLIMHLMSNYCYFVRVEFGQHAYFSLLLFFIEIDLVHLENNGTEPYTKFLSRG